MNTQILLGLNFVFGIIVGAFLLLRFIKTSIIPDVDTAARLLKIIADCQGYYNMPYIVNAYNYIPAIMKRGHFEIRQHPLIPNAHCIYFIYKNNSIEPLNINKLKPFQK